MEADKVDNMAAIQVIVAQATMVIKDQAMEVIVAQATMVIKDPAMEVIKDPAMEEVIKDPGMVQMVDLNQEDLTMTITIGLKILDNNNKVEATTIEKFSFLSLSFQKWSNKRKSNILHKQEKYSFRRRI